MINIFEFPFMQRAFVVGILLSIIISLIGVIIVFRRLSMLGDTLSHSSLAGVAFGLMIGINPLVGASIAAIIAALGIEAIRKKIPKFSEMSLVIIMSAGVGLAGVLSGFVKTSVSFHSFLFGSIVAISNFELTLVVITSIFVIVSFMLLQKELFFITLDERSAKLAGVPVWRVNFVFTILTAITVSIAARTVGTLMVASMMVIPVACAMQFGKSFKQTILYSISFSLGFTIVGLFVSFYGSILFGSLKPGATIVLLGIISLTVILIFKKKAIAS